MPLTALPDERLNAGFLQGSSLGLEQGLDIDPSGDLIPPRSRLFGFAKSSMLPRLSTPGG